MNNDDIEAHLEEVIKNKEYIIYCNSAEIGSVPHGPYERPEVCEAELYRKIRYTIFRVLKRNEWVEIERIRGLSIDRCDEGEYEGFVRLRMIVVVKPSKEPR